MLRSLAKRALFALRRFYLRLVRGPVNLDPRSLLPIIVFQPGKVGSSSVHASLLRKHAELGVSVPIYHAHVLENIDKRIEYITRYRKAPAASLRKLEESRRLVERIRLDPSQGWNVINLVRDPVALKVSALFQVLHEYLPDWESRWQKGELSLDELDEILFHRQELGTGGLESWYDGQIKSLWGIDVFAETFSREQGFQIYHRGNINLMIIRLEDLNRVAASAFNEFLGLPGFQIVNANVGEDKPYAQLYEKYKQRPLPAEFVDAVYATRFARHFYSAEELQGFARKWTGQKKAADPALVNGLLTAPVVVFQSGKVGSMSVLASLRLRYKNMGLSTPVYHSHRLEKIDEQIEFVRTARNAPDNTIRKLIESKQIRGEIDSDPQRPWNVLTLVRDPVAQRVSALFQLIHEYIPDWRNKLETGTLALSDLQAMLLEKEEFEVQRLDLWFDEQMKPVWGVDLYDLPFDCRQGYQVYRPSLRLNLMIVRLEDLDRVAARAFQEFLGLRNFSVTHTNTSEEKPYHELYERFKSLPMPVELVDGAYATRYARHFYTQDELDRFRRRWISGAPAQSDGPPINTTRNNA